MDIAQPSQAGSLNQEDFSSQQLAQFESIANSFRKSQKKQIEYLVAMLEAGQQLRDVSDYDGERLEAWLRTQLGVAEDEARIIARCPPDVLAHMSILEAGNQTVATIYAIISSDERTRSECYIRIKRKDRVDVGVVEEIKQAHALKTIPAEELERTERSKEFDRAATEFGAASLAQLEHMSERLLGTFDRTFSTLGEEEAWSSDAKHPLRKDAAKALKMFEALFGTNHAPRDRASAIVSHGIAIASLAYTWHTLRDLATGAFGDGAKLGQSNVFRSRPRKCLEFLAGRRHSAISHSEALGPFPYLRGTPSFVDIDAGVGGTALGLEAAGFKAVGIWVSQQASQKALWQNRPSWSPKWYLPKNGFLTFARDLSRLKRRQAVDLVTSGLPWDYYSPKKYHEASASRAFKKSVLAVRILRPKVFVFETDLPSPDHVVAKPFEDVGYDVRWHSLDVSSFGVAQAKSRSVMIGARDGHLDGFLLPVVDPPYTRTLAETIGDLVAGFDEHGNRLSDEEPCPEDLAKWTNLCSERIPLAPALPKYHGRKKSRDWRACGIDISEYTSRPPLPKDLKSPGCFRLTIRMLGRIQGFPDKWHLVASPIDTHQVGNAFPPPAAKMLGLAIHSALTGAAFDYQNAARRNLLHYFAREVGPACGPEWPAKSASWSLSDPKIAFKKTGGTLRRKKVHYQGMSTSDHPSSLDQSSVYLDDEDRTDL